MPESDYTVPVARLLTIGDPGLGQNWPDYLEKYELTAADIPALIRMAADEELSRADSESTLVWASLHAWRSLGQLHAEEAIQALLGILHWIDDYSEDWVESELPDVFAMIGPACVPALKEYLADPKHGKWARLAASESLAKMGTQYVETCGECTAAITAELEKFADNDDEFNAYLIQGLVELGAVEAAPLVERAFSADRVDEAILGDWEDFQVEVGLLEKRITPYDEFGLGTATALGGVERRGKEDKKTKKKHKQEKQSRKKNRKKK